MGSVGEQQLFQQIQRFRRGIRQRKPAFPTVVTHQFHGRFHRDRVDFPEQGFNQGKEPDLQITGSIKVAVKSRLYQGLCFCGQKI